MVVLDSFIAFVQYNFINCVLKCLYTAYNASQCFESYNITFYLCSNCFF